MAIDKDIFTGGLASLISGFLNNSGDPYAQGMDIYNNYTNDAAEKQRPFYDAGTAAIPQYQNWLNSMKDPAAFVNNLTKNYSASPYSQYLQQQSLLSGQNAFNAYGLGGSTAMAKFLQENAHNLASSDLEKYLQNVIGINTTYGQGQQNMINSGQNAANALGNLRMNQGKFNATQEEERQKAENNDTMNAVSGFLSLGSLFL